MGRMTSLGGLDATVWTDARAANIDAILADTGTTLENRQVAILADVTGLNGDAMRGTDMALYEYSALLANATSFIPPQDTVVMLATLTGIGGAGEFRVRTVAPALDVAQNSFVADSSYSGFYGSIMCDGTDVGFHNNSGAQETIALWGVTLG